MSIEKRRARRVLLNAPTTIQPLAPSERAERGDGDALAGGRFAAIVRDISVNGAFIAGAPLALLTRVAFSFELPEFGVIEVQGLSLWRREVAAHERDAEGERIISPPGFGILFEALPLDARVAIHKFIEGQRE